MILNRSLSEWNFRLIQLYPLFPHPSCKSDSDGNSLLETIQFLRRTRTAHDEIIIVIDGKMKIYAEIAPRPVIRSQQNICSTEEAFKTSKSVFVLALTALYGEHHFVRFCRYYESKCGQLPLAITGRRLRSATS
jgi:hypothetical protein